MCSFPMHAIKPYDSPHFNHRHYSRVSGQLHASTVLFLGKQPLFSLNWRLGGYFGDEKCVVAVANWTTIRRFAARSLSPIPTAKSLLRAYPDIFPRRKTGRRGPLKRPILSPVSSPCDFLQLGTVTECAHDALQH